MPTPHKVLIIHDDDIFAEKWAYGIYEEDGHLGSRESGSEMTLSDRRWDSKTEVAQYLYHTFTDDAWMYDIVRVLTVFDYEEVGKA